MRADFDVDKEFQRQWAIIARGAVDILPLDEFKSKLMTSIRDSKPLRVKQGFDPTSPDIHLGHTVGMRKLRQFQDLGHQIVLIVGDYTGMVGDPSGRSSTRPQLTYDEIMRNAETYEAQFFKVLDRSRTEIRSNGEWFKKMDFIEIMHLAMKFTVARLLERDDFTNRYKAGLPISVHELFYPLMQAYDSVAIRADVEIGGTEQKFNLLAGRTIQEAYGVPQQCILTLPLLLGIDGQMKMSKSLGNYIGIEEPPKDIFGKAMKIPDELTYQYFELATDVSIDQLAEIKARLSAPGVNPMTVKKELGEKLVDMYYPTGTGAKAREQFERQFSMRETPDDVEQCSLVRYLDEKGVEHSKPVLLVHLLTDKGLTKSNSDGRRLIQQKGIEINGQAVEDPNLELTLGGSFNSVDNLLIKVGKRRFLKVTRD